MSIFDNRRLTNDTFKLDAERMRGGWYSDKYFENIVGMLADLARRAYRFGGSSVRLVAAGIDPRGVDIGGIEVEMQWFTRRAPFSVVAGVDKALAILECCTGYYDEDGRFVNTFDHLAIEAVHDGAIVRFEGDPLNVQPVLFFPARFDAHEVQAADGYAYNIAVQRYNLDYGHTIDSYISTDAQGDWWGGLGGGTIAHAAIAAFLGDTVECMLAFAETRPVETPRIALVDFDNDCVGASLAVMDAMFARYRELMDAGRADEARRYKLFGVRPDTSATVRDVSVPPLGMKELDMGVTPRLVFFLRNAIDQAWTRWALPPEWIERARAWCRDVRIVVTGGFNPRKIRRFEELGVPVDIYGVGSSLFSNSSEEGTNNDFTADVVRVKIGSTWHDLVKVGRRACANPDLQRIH